MSFTTIPAKGGKSLNIALRAIAEKRQIPVSDLVTNALKAAYGSELESLLSFFASNERQIVQSTVSTSEPTKEQE